LLALEGSPAVSASSSHSGEGKGLTAVAKKEKEKRESLLHEERPTTGNPQKEEIKEANISQGGRGGGTRLSLRPPASSLWPRIGEKG